METFKKSQELTALISFVDSENVALPITGFTVTFMMKVNESDPDADALVTKVSPTGVTITNAALGLAECVLSASDLDAINTTRVFCEAKAVNGTVVYRTETVVATVKVNVIKSNT